MNSDAKEKLDKREVEEEKDTAEGKVKPRMGSDHPPQPISTHRQGPATAEILQKRQTGAAHSRPGRPDSQGWKISQH